MVSESTNYSLIGHNLSTKNIILYTLVTLSSSLNYVIVILPLFLLVLTPFIYLLFYSSVSGKLSLIPILLLVLILLGDKFEDGILIEIFLLF